MVGPTQGAPGAPLGAMAIPAGSRPGPAPSARRAGPRGRGETVRAVSGPGRRARMRGIGAVQAVLHIQPEQADGGSAESCGNSPALNTVEILPCAEGPSLHMGARPLKTGILARTPESRGKPTIDPRPPPLPMCNTPARLEKNLAPPGSDPPAGPAAPRSAPIGSEAPANREKWRSGRIVPPRTRRPPRLNRGIMRMTPDVFNVADANDPPRAPEPGPKRAPHHPADAGRRPTGRP